MSAEPSRDPGAAGTGAHIEAATEQLDVVNVTETSAGPLTEDQARQVTELIRLNRPQIQEPGRPLLHHGLDDGAP